MKLPAVISNLFRSKGAVTPLAYGDGWPIRIMESFAGAFQAHVVVDAPRDITAFSAVFACTTKIASDIAKMCPELVEELPSGICEEVDNSPYSKVLTKPNHFQNRIAFFKQWVACKLLFGNAYALKQREGRTMVKALYLLDPQRVTPLVTDDGAVYYRLAADNLSGLPQTITVPASEIIHDLMTPLWHPLVGVSPIHACGLSATMGNRIQKNSTRFFQNMSRAGGALVAPGKLDPADAATLKREWEENFGGINSGRTAVLANGLKYEPMSIPANEAQLIEQLKWTVEDVARCYGVPLYKIGGPVPPNTSVESLDQAYYSECLQVLIEDIELCLTEGLELPANYSVEFDLDDLLRMDTAARYEATGKAVKDGWMTPNEARARENLTPIKGGDTCYMQQQQFSLEALAKRDALPNPFVIDRPTANPTPSPTGPAETADPKSANDEYAAAFEEIFIKGLRASAA